MKNVKDVVKFAVAIAEGVRDSLEDNKLTVKDLPNFLKALTLAPSAFNGINLVLKEFTEMTPEQKEELINEVQLDLKVSCEKAERVLNESLRIVLGIVVITKTLHDIKKAKK